MLLVKCVLVVLMVTLCLGQRQLGTYELLDYDPVSNPAATFVFGPGYRVTALSAELVRLEVAGKSGAFEDRATIAMVNRNLPPPAGLRSSDENGVFELRTDAIALQWRYGDNSTWPDVQAERLDGTAKWSWGQTNANSDNLLGTIRSLDELNVMTLNCTQNADVIVHGESLHCAWGVVGRQGFALVDDTGNYALTSDASWWDSPSVDSADVYLFLHGRNYKRALRDYVRVAGLPAMTPRAAMGIWSTRWYNFASNDVKRVVAEYDSRSLPLDVQVLDMNWHTKQLWTGWTPDATLWPLPADGYGWLHAQGLLLLVNVHDAQGVAFYEQMFPQMATAMGLDPDPLVTNDVPFSAVNSSYLYSLDDIVLGSLVQQGVDYAWIDWQQGNAQTAGDGQNPTIILAKVRATDYLRWNDTSKRGMVLSRFGGYGAQRYPVGFSGDVASLSWADLAYQPYFSLTAANVAYSWSHDLVGPHDDLEMMTRWLQWGAYSGVFRSHDRGMSTGSCNDDLTLAQPGTCAIVWPWMVSEIYFLANRACMRDREALVPYTYTAMREYFESANENGTFNQYFFGSADMMVSPVVSPSDDTQMTLHTVWLPPGTWFERDTGRLHVVKEADGRNLTKYFDLSEIPIFIRGGAVIATRPLPLHSTLGVAAQPYSRLLFTVYPGGAHGTRQVYEDDGLSMAYLTSGSYGVTTFAYQRSAARFKATITAAAPQSYHNQPATRQWTLVLANSLPPVSVLVAGAAYPAGPVAASWQRWAYNSQQPVPAASPTWSYDGESFSLVVTLPELSAADVSIDIAWDDGVAAQLNETLLSGLKGVFRHAMIAKTALDLPSVTEGSHSIMGGYLNLATSLPDALGYWAGADTATFVRTVQQYRDDVYPSAVAEVDGMFPPAPGSFMQLYSQARFDSCLCAVQQCLVDNADYQQVLVEGWQESPSAAAAVPLYWYWNANVSDNYMTTDPVPPPGYQYVGINGYVRSQPSDAAQTLPLSVYYHPVYLDHMTVATRAGVQLAQSRGYQCLNQTIGYVYATNQTPDPQQTRGLPEQLVLYAYTLLTSVYNP